MTENVIIKDINCKGINVVDLVKHILNKKCNNIYTQKMENKHIIVSADFFDDMRNRQVNMSLLLDYDESTIYEVKLEIHQDENDLIDYSMDLKLYYYENLDIYKAIQEIRAENDTPKTVRIYKLMYNSYPIKGTYSFNLKNCKLIFHTLNIKERTEPLTEQIVAFDVKLKSNNMQEARAKAYNIVSDFVSYLSLLLDVCFYDPQSIYRNFVRLSYDSHYQRIIAQERYRTAFIDNELELVVKDNLNGLATYKDVIKGENFDNGVISIANPDKSDVKFIEKYGNTKHIEEVFEKHRLEKVPKNQTVYCDEIKEEIFVLGQEIFIPKCIRDYFRGIEELDDKIRKKVAGACLNGQALVTSVAKEEKTVAQPKLYDLTTLQRDANRLFGFTAKQTLEYTQSLYEKKLCTYPRTDSQYLSDDMEKTARNVIKAIFSSILFEENMMFNPDIKRVLNSKKVTDHHAIIPTMEIAKADLAALPETERKILSLVANRLLCATGEKHLYETVKAELSCGSYTFTTSGKSVLKNGWKDFEDAFKRSFKTTEDKVQEDKKLPELSEGQTFDGVQTKISEHYTNPPKHFTEDSLLSAMERAGSEDMGDDVERKGLGTPATRADIIEKLVKDGFVKRERKQMIPTEDGMKLITVLPDVVKSPKLTADWENALRLIVKGGCINGITADTKSSG